MQREMDISNEGNGSGGEGSSSNSRRSKKQYHRHSAQQIQQLEDFYKQCPHPDRSRRQQLSRELGLDVKQIKFWFQNKRTHMKAQNEKADNDSLRAENEKIHCENLTLQHSLRNISCPVCNGPGIGDKERNYNLKMLRLENAKLKEEHERAVSFISNQIGNLNMLPGIDIPASILGQGLNLCSEMMGNYTMHLHPKASIIIETAIRSMNELIKLLHVNEPVWIKAGVDGRQTLHKDSYDKLFPKPNHFRSTSARSESSKACGEVAISATHLVETLLDVNKWKDMFATIVTKAECLDVLDTGNVGGILQLVYEKTHILSPLVAPREFHIIRYCQQLKPTTWAMVNVSYDFVKGVQDVTSGRSWKLPSGLLIEELSNGKTMITWIEHVQVDDKLWTDRLYRDLVFGCQAYGARRWITTLQMMCERLAYSVGLTTTDVGGVIGSIEGCRNLMQLSHRMVKNFCEILSTPDKDEFRQLSEFRNSGIRLSLQRSEGPGQPEGFMVSASSSFRLPFSMEYLFNFFNDKKERAKWDILAGGNPVSSVAEIPTGTQPGNCISILQPFAPKEINILMLQESSINAHGALITYAPLNLEAVVSVVSGEDTTRVPILPSGFVISGDGSGENRFRASTSSGEGGSGGSILTASFQILVCHGTLRRQLNMESVAAVHTLISSTIQKIKAALNYFD